MRNKRVEKLIIRAGILPFFLGTLVCAQGFGPFMANVGGGVTPLTGGLQDRLTTGWNAQVGGGFNFSHWVGVNLEYQYNGLGVKSSVIRDMQVAGGSAHIWSGTLNPVVRLAGPESRVVPYVTGGGGYYRRTMAFTVSSSEMTNIVDPWWGTTSDVAVPSAQAFAKTSEGCWGWNGGVGFTTRLGNSNTKLYLEGRYHYAEMRNGIVRIIPVTLGIRW